MIRLCSHVNCSTPRIHSLQIQKPFIFLGRSHFLSISDISHLCGQIFDKKIYLNREVWGLTVQRRGRDGNGIAGDWLRCISSYKVNNCNYDQNIRPKLSPPSSRKVCLLKVQQFSKHHHQMPTKCSSAEAWKVHIQSTQVLRDVPPQGFNWGNSQTIV